MIGTQNHPTGHFAGKDFIDSADRDGMKIGIVVRVDEINMKADVKVITGGAYRFEIDLTQGMCGPRSFWGGIPEVNSLVIIGYRRIHKNLSDAMIIGYLPMGNRSGLRFDPVSPTDPQETAGDPEAERVVGDTFGGTVRYKRLLLGPGDVGGMSSAGAELVLSKDLRMVNRAGDLFELRDSTRTIVSQSIHRVEADAGVRRYSGPARRSGTFLPPDIFKAVIVGTRVRFNDDIVTVSTIDGANITLSNGKAVSLYDLQLVDLKTLAEGYYGLDNLQATGPGPQPDDKAKFANASGEVNESFMDFAQLPPVTFSNGRRTHYAPTEPAVSIEDPDEGADAFVEDRIELSHATDLVQEVLDDIDGFAADLRVPYITRVFGTVIGSDLTSTQGQRQYGQVLKPVIFPDFQTPSKGTFAMESVNRQPTSQQDEAKTAAAAFLFKMRPPAAKSDNVFACAVTKEGKVMLNIPASKSEAYPSGTNKISAEINMEGALKAYIGASNPDRVSAHITMEGGLHLDIGADAQGNVSSAVFKGGTKVAYQGVPNEDDVAREVEVQGVDSLAVSGAQITNVLGMKNTQVSGMYQIGADRLNINANSGYSLNTSEKNELVSGKSQLQYALAVISTIVAGGEVKTILAGASVTTLAAGALSFTVAAGATSFVNPAGAFAITVGTGALTATTAAGAVTLSTAAGAMTLSCGAGAMAITSGLAMSLTAGAVMTLIAPSVILGGPSVFGVLRGIPGPPGAPTLNPFTGLPMLGGSPIVLAI